MYKIQPKTKIVGKNLVYLPSCHSTNQIALKLIQNQDSQNGTLVITENQTEGKGQRGNSWESEIGKNITMSIVLETNFIPINSIFDLNRLVSLSILDVLKKLDSQNFKIKWPNDIFYENKKIGGILIENIISANSLSKSVIGIGLNINQEKFESPQASSIKNLFGGRHFEIEGIIEEICEKLEFRTESYRNSTANLLNDEYLANLLNYNKLSKYKDKNENFFEGKIVEVNQHGNLILEIDNEKTHFDLKELTFLF